MIKTVRRRDFAILAAAFLIFTVVPSVFLRGYSMALCLLLSVTYLLTVIFSSKVVKDKKPQSVFFVSLFAAAFSYNTFYLYVRASLGLNGVVKMYAALIVTIVAVLLAFGGKTQAIAVLLCVALTFVDARLALMLSAFLFAVLVCCRQAEGEKEKRTQYAALAGVCVLVLGVSAWLVVRHDVWMLINGMDYFEKCRGSVFMLIAAAYVLLRCFSGNFSGKGAVAVGVCVLGAAAAFGAVFVDIAQLATSAVFIMLFCIYIVYKNEQLFRVIEKDVSSHTAAFAILAALTLS